MYPKYKYILTNVFAGSAYNFIKKTDLNQKKPHVFREGLLQMKE